MIPSAGMRCCFLIVVTGCGSVAATSDAGGDGLVADAPADGASGSSGATLAAGGSHTCAAAAGSVRCWGDGASGMLGYGNLNNIGDDETPASAGTVALGGVAVGLAAGVQHSCALLDTGAVRCWGDGGRGQLGYGNLNDLGDNESPSSAGDVDLGGTAVQVAAGGDHSCALLDTGAVRCWGAGSGGQLGYANTSDVGDNEAPATAGDISLGGTAVEIAVGGHHTCARLSTGAVRCWGDGSSGQLGYANTSDVGDNEAPASAGDVALGGIAVALAAGGFHTCALLTTGTVRCCGAGFSGALGYGNGNSIGDDETPSTAGDVPLGAPAVALAAGAGHTCAVLTTGEVRCWGYGIWGQLGYGNTSSIGDDETPASAGNVSVGGPVVALAAGSTHTCARLTTGAVRCWGDGSFGQLGHGNSNDLGDDESPSSAGDVPLE